MANDCYLSSSLTTRAAAHCVFGAVRDRIDVFRGATNRVARCRRKRSANQGDRQNLLKHDVSPLSGMNNAVVCGRVQTRNEFGLFPERHNCISRL